MYQKDYPRVALLVESSRAYGRGLLLGISRYLREHRQWSVMYQELKWTDPPPRWLKRGQINGIIARVEQRQLANAIERTGVPAVDVRGTLTDLKMPLIDTDDDIVPRLAVEHLLERGFRNFAYCGFVGANYSDKRQRGFVTRLAEAGYSCNVYSPPRVVPHRLTIEYELNGLMLEADVAKWLTKLPKPIGLMACNDIRGQQILNVCHDIGLTVPDEVAVIGVDNDEILCELSDPPMTSVAPDTIRVGYEAAKLLARLLAGKPAPKAPLYISPTGIVTRRSTDVLAIKDRNIAGVLRFIRDHACDGIDVTDVLETVPLSRTLLDRSFFELVGRSPKAEIVRVQIDRARQLLAETDLTMEDIADRTGFRHTEYFCVAFKRETGKTPGQFRKSTRYR